MLLPALILSAALPAPLQAPLQEPDLLEPGAPFDYASQAFYPARWTKGGWTEPMLPWVGEEICFVTREDAKLDAKTMTDLVATLDAGWQVYEDLAGCNPRPYKQHKGKPTIVALPADGLTCGYGCGYVGATGIEMTRFYADHYPALVRDPRAVPHAYFYEMGRNHYGFGARHDAFVTGYAVFMRYVCLDTLELPDADARTAKTIRGAIDLWEKSSLDFVTGFTSHGGKGEKEPRLFDAEGRPVWPSDQPVLYASLMLRLREEHGGDAFVKRFYDQVRRSPEVKARDRKSARRQCLQLLIAASLAARTDLTSRFRTRYRLEISDEVAAALGEVDWKSKDLTVANVLASL